MLTKIARVRVTAHPLLSQAVFGAGRLASARISRLKPDVLLLKLTGGRVGVEALAGLKQHLHRLKPRLLASARISRLKREGEQLLLHRVSQSMYRDAQMKNSKHGLKTLCCSGA